MTPIERAEKAQQLLDDPVLKAAFRDIRELLVAKLEQTAMSDVDTHHEVALTLQCLSQVKLMLATYTNEIKVQEHKEKQDTFMGKMRQRIVP